MPIMVWNYKMVFTLTNIGGHIIKKHVENTQVKIENPIYISCWVKFIS
jgi:hypothetical protein